jgi:putative ABC transport system permease protein
MKYARQFLARIANLVTRRHQEERLRTEIEEHIALQTDENLRAGMLPAEARRQALLKFGAVEAIKEAYRDQQAFPFFENLLRDAAYGLRVLRKSPGFTTVAVLTLALGIAANIAVFSIVYGVIFRPLPYPEPQRIVQLTETSPHGTDEIDVTYDELQFLQRRRSPFEALAGYTVVGFNLGIGNKTEHVKAIPASANYFHVLGVRPFLGRDFLPQEDQGNGARVTILGYETWRRQAGANRGIVGQTIALNGEPFTVIGVMPDGMENTNDPILPGEASVWVPIAMVSRTLGAGENIAVLGRLRPGISLTQAVAELNSLTADFRKAFPLELGPSTALTLKSYQSMLVGDSRSILFLLLGAVGFVWLIACANVANLLLGRAAVRSREFAVRAALGAHRSRIARQMLTESVLLSIIAACLALLLVRLGMQSVLALSPADFPRISDIHVDGFVFLFTFLLAILTGLIFGLPPTFRISSANIYQKLMETTTRASGSRAFARMRAALAVGEVALCLILLTGAALMVETFGHVLKTDPGFNPSSMLAVEVWLEGRPYNSTASQIRYYDEVLRRMQRLPGVQSASVVAAGLPLQRGGTIGAAVKGTEVQRSFDIRMITTGYPQTLGIPLVLGRTFTPEDGPNAPPLAVISQSAAKIAFPGVNPVGRRIEVLNAEREIVGVVGDVRSYLDHPAEPTVYVPLAQCPYEPLQLFSSVFPTNVVVRTSAAPSVIGRSIEQQLRSVDPSVASGHIRTMRQVRGSAVAARKVNMVLLSVFAGLALLLAAIGVYGVISYGVKQRTHEFGVRLALGARPAEIVRDVIREGLTFVSLGVVFGLVGALALTRLLKSYLYGVAPSDPVALAGTTVLLIAVALAALVVPALQAARVDPMVALRYE